MPDWVISLFFVFVGLPILGALYVAFVHRAGAFVVRLLPLPLARFFGAKLWTTDWDMARRTDRIRGALNSKRKKAGKAVEGELLPPH